jgi:anti-sigma regulatory factor (Ser/Thr protein kinase)
LSEYEIRIAIASKLDQVWQVRVAIAAILKELDVADIDCLHVQLAVAEAINNCIEHGYCEDVNGRIDVFTQVREERLTIEIMDDGQPLPIEELEQLLKKPIPEPCENMPLLSSGRGLQIMRSTMDSVVFWRQGDRNKLTLRKVLRRIYTQPEFHS